MMNSGSETRNPLSQKPSSAAHSSRNLSSRLSQAADSSPLPKDPPPSSAARKENGRSAANGYDSDAETDILSDAEKQKPTKKKRTAHDTNDRLRSSPSIIAKSEPSPSHPTSRRSSMNGGSTKETRRVNGVDRKDEGKRTSNAKLRSAEKATSSSSRAQSAEASLSIASSGPSETAYDSPDRTRQSLSVEPRKRKLSDEHPKSKLEPPRQRPRLDSTGSKSKRISSPSSNPPPSAGHKRSISNQSGVARPSSRKKRDASATSQQSDDPRRWADDSSDDSSSPPPRKGGSIPHLAPPKSRSMSQRALTSPARTNLLHSRRADKYGTTPLAKACEKGQINQVRRAYEQAPEELDQEDNGGFTPLQKASLGGHFEVVKFLLDKGCRRDCFSKEERDTPLIDAVENGHYKVVKLLLDRGVNPYHANKKGVRAIDAVNYEEDNAKEIEIALKKAMDEYQGAEDEHEEDPVHESPASQIRREGGGLRPDLLYQALTPENLLKYSTSGDLEAIGMLLESVEPSVACAVAAARGGHVVALGLLLASAQSMERDPSPIKYEETPMLAAIGRGHLKIIELLLDQDNFNPCRKTRDGKTYYEVAADRRGPRWQAEYELLKARYDSYKENSGKKRESKSAKAAAKDSSPKSPRLAKTAIKKLEKSVAPTVEDDKEKRQKRLSGGSAKDSAVKELPRKRRVVDEESSEGVSDTEHPSSRRRIHGSTSSKPQRKTSSAGSTKHNDEQPSLPSSPRAKFGRKPKVKREEVDADNDVTMDDVPPAKEEKRSRIRQREEAAAERKAKEEAEAQLRAEAEAREKEEREAREREEAEKKRLAEEAARKREEFLASLPIMLRRALERGMDRPMLSYRPMTPASSPGMVPEKQARIIGVKEAFLPLLTVKWQDLDWSLTDESKMNERFILSHHVVGVLGLPELDVKLAYPNWETQPVTKEHLEKYIKGWDISKVMMETMWPQAGQKGYDHDAATKAIADCKAQFIALHDKLCWVKLEDFKHAFEDLKATEAGKKLHELGELKELVFFNLRRPPPPGYKPYEDPDRCVRINAVKPKPAHLRSGLGSVYIPRSAKDVNSPLLDVGSPINSIQSRSPMNANSRTGSPMAAPVAAIDEDTRME